MSSSIVSDPWDVSRFINYTAQFVWSGSGVVGNLKVQASNDGVNWADLPLSMNINIDVDSCLFEAKYVGYKWARFVFTRTAGTGLMSLIVASRGV